MNGSSSGIPTQRGSISNANETIFDGYGAVTRYLKYLIASMSLDWNYGEGFQEAFFDAYEIKPDSAKLSYYRSLWHLES